MSADLVSHEQQAQQSRVRDWPSILEFYSGRDVFVTGGTGYMGKCLLEKMLRSIPRGGRIFVLVRAKKGKRPEERIAELTSSKVTQHGAFLWLLRRD